MTCDEFQRVLPYIMEGGGSDAEQTHVQSCPHCSALVEDLNSIAAQARLMLPLRDPSPAVWSGIRESLEREGLVRPAGNVVRLRPDGLRPRSWSWAAMFAVAALVLLSFALVRYRNLLGAPPAAVPVTQAQVAPAAPLPADQEVVLAVSARNPDLRATYETGLRDVNDYIHSAQQTVDLNPDDPDAHEQLMQAYQQKAMLYDMALSRATQ
jgi:hypothetical protein